MSYFTLDESQEKAAHAWARKLLIGEGASMHQYSSAVFMVERDEVELRLFSAELIRALKKLSSRNAAKK